jgi:hypothetical protein
LFYPHRLARFAIYAFFCSQNAHWRAAPQSSPIFYRMYKSIEIGEQKQDFIEFFSGKKNPLYGQYKGNSMEEGTSNSAKRPYCFITWNYKINYSKNLNYYFLCCKLW